MRSWLEPDDPDYTKYYGTHADGNSFYNTIVQGQSGYLGDLMEQVLGIQSGGVGIPAGVGNLASSSSSTTAASPAATSGAASTAAASSSKMGLESWLPLLIGQLGSSAIGGLLQPKPEKRQSFLNRGVDPADMLQNSNEKANQLYTLLMDYFSQPVSFRGSYAPAVPGSSIHDAAIDDPTLLSRPGMLDKNKFAESWAASASQPKTPVRRRTTSGNF